MGPRGALSNTPYALTPVFEPPIGGSRTWGCCWGAQGVQLGDPGVLLGGLTRGAAGDSRPNTYACSPRRLQQGPGVLLGGRALDVDLAVDKDAARSIAIAQQGGKVKLDKKSLYLLKEGAIEEGSTAWQGMSDHDQ